MEVLNKCATLKAKKAWRKQYRKKTKIYMVMRMNIMILNQVHKKKVPYKAKNLKNYKI